MTRRAGSRPPAAKPAFPVIGVVFVGLAVFLSLAIVLSGGDSGDTDDDAAAPQITGATLPQLPDMQLEQPEDDPGFGLAAPEVTGQDYAGNTVEITHDGIPRAIVFLAHWCSVCQGEVSEIQAWLNDGGGVEGVELLSVSTWATSTRDNYPPSAWLERENWTTPIIADDDDASLLTSFGGNGVPFWVFLDADSKVVFRISGGMNAATLQSILELLRG
jgi:hypothetical protein